MVKLQGWFSFSGYLLSLLHSGKFINSSLRLTARTAAYYCHSVGLENLVALPKRRNEKMMKRICLSSVLLLCLAVAVFTTTVDDERLPLNSDHDHDFVDDKGKSSLPPFKKDVDDTVLARPHNAEAESEQHSKPMDNLNPGDVILGDIRLTEEQKKFMEEDGHNGNGSRTKRNVETGATWPDATLPYEIDSELDALHMLEESRRDCNRNQYLSRQAAEM
eukprot:XP_011682869.1 PREDICTED: uncharacterized protein LOC105447004 [Strongylocentrotus purpuratus]